MSTTAVTTHAQNGNPTPALGDALGPNHVADDGNVVVAPTGVDVCSAVVDPVVVPGPVDPSVVDSAVEDVVSPAVVAMVVAAGVAEHGGRMLA